MALRFSLSIICLIGTASLTAHSQMITGVWKGKINRQKVEVKIIQQADSLTGTSYYYESGSRFRRYLIKGYFDPQTNEAVWWDDQLIVEETGQHTGAGKMPLLSRADFNCPGSGKMMLDGKSVNVTNENKKAGEVHLEKSGETSFPDEWDFVIENYTRGASDPDIIDSVSAIALQQTIKEEALLPVPTEKKETVLVKEERAVPIIVPPIKDETKPAITIPATIEEKFVSRKKVLVTEIPVSGDSIELRFYDNAEIDGDSISLFLNDQLIFRHIRLTGNAYSIKLPVQELKEINELTMVAENLGSIPPNTSFMVALVGDKRYEARLESTEGSSAMIRLLRNK